MKAGDRARAICHDRVKADQATRYADTTRRLEELAERDGPGSIWQELLEERAEVRRGS
jgi:hypothetical protein